MQRMYRTSLCPTQFKHLITQMSKTVPIRYGCTNTNQTVTHSTLGAMLYCFLIWGLTYMFILNLQMNKVSSWDTRKVKVSKDVKINKIPGSDEKKNRDLTISWITNAHEFCSSRSFIPCIFTMVAYARDLKLQQFPQVHKRSNAKPKNTTWELMV